MSLNIAEGAGCSTDTEFARFLGYAYRSLKEVVTCLESSERLYPVAHSDVVPLADEGDQIARMTCLCVGWHLHEFAALKTTSHDPKTDGLRTTDN